MDNKKDNIYYASKALESINIIHDYFGIMSYEEFLKTQKFYLEPETSQEQDK